MAGNIWDNFSSQSYKDLPSVGEITWYHPYTGEARTYTMPAGGRGYTRPPSLVSLWSTAPFLLNNTVGRLRDRARRSRARMRSFDDSIRKMLWPEERDKDSLLGDKIPGVIDRVGDRAPDGHGTQPVYLKFSAGTCRTSCKRTLRTQQALFPSLFTDDGIRIGPIPTGHADRPARQPAICSSEDRDPQQVEHDARVGALHGQDSGAAAQTRRQRHRRRRPGRHSADLVDPLLELSKCPDFVVNRGHLFGTELADADKRALIEFLKTF